MINAEITGKQLQAPRRNRIRFRVENEGDMITIQRNEIVTTDISELD